MSSNGNPSSSRATSSRNRNPSARSQEAAASTSYFKWTIVPQQHLLNWLGEDDNYNRFRNAGKVDASGRSRSSGKTKIAVAGEAAEFLGTKGFQVDAKQVQSKVTQLEDKYRAATKELDQTGNGLLTTEAKMGVESIRDKVLKICPCFEDLDPIFMDRAVHKPLLTTDSSQGFHGLISTLGRRPSRRTDDANDPESRDSEGPSTGAAMPAPRRRTGMAIQSIMNDDEGTRSPSTRRDSASLSPQRGPQRRSASPQRRPSNRSASPSTPTPTRRSSPPAGRNAEVAPTAATGGTAGSRPSRRNPRPVSPPIRQGIADLVNRACDERNEAIEKREDRRNQLAEERLKLSRERSDRERERADREQRLEERTTTLAEAELALKQRMEERLAAREDREAAAAENLRKEELAIRKLEAEAAKANAEAAKVQAELKLMEMRARGFN